MFMSFVPYNFSKSVIYTSIREIIVGAAIV